jgi:hypothetical protein
MKRYAVFLLLIGATLFGLSSCAANRQQTQEMELQAWISAAKRPIQVTKHNSYNHFTTTRGSHFYTLIDQEGKVFLAKNVRYELPDAIK